MTPDQDQYYKRVLVPFETELQVLRLGELFSGTLYDNNDQPITGLRLPDMS